MSVPSTHAANVLSAISSLLNARSEPANWIAPAMKESRPAPEPAGSYVIVTSGLASWTPAVQVWTATSCEVAPPPAISPEMAGPADSDGVVDPPSFAAQPARARAAMAATAPTWAMREILTV